MPLMLITDLAARFTSLKRDDRPVIVGIDGLGGSGKSTLAALLGRELAGVVVNIDDFYRPASERQPGQPFHGAIGGNFDWPRLEHEVLQPISKGQAGRYQRYDWPTDALAEWHDVATDRPSIIEGVTVLRPELRDYYDFTIWVDCPTSLRLNRALSRDGEHMRETWVNQWIPAEEAYVDYCQPRAAADLIVDGTIDITASRAIEVLTGC